MYACMFEVMHVCSFTDDNNSSDDSDDDIVDHSFQRIITSSKHRTVSIRIVEFFEDQHEISQSEQNVEEEIVR